MHLYIHIPFCHRECPYCAFYKHTPGKTKLRAFIDALVAEAKLRIPQNTAPSSIFFGGGTPSMLSPVLFDRLCQGLAQHLDLSQVQEWTIEANPATFTLKKAQGWKQAGVTRVSMGVQSFNPRLLAILGRDHSPEAASQGVQILRQAGIGQINIDLMFSLPSQNREEWRHSLQRAIDLGVDHISTYNLTMEEDTPFFTQYGADATEEEEDVAMFLIADETLTQAGYRHYEVSNFAKEGCRSLHNLACWQGKDYIGLGPGACSTDQGMRIENKGDTDGYINALSQGQMPPRTEEKLSAQDREAELIALALRTDEGLAKQLIRAEHEGYVQQLVEEGLASLSPQGQLTLLPKGRLLTDEIALGFL